MLGYSDGLLMWLLECQKNSQADKVRHFLNDFVKYVRSNLDGSSVWEEQADV